MLYILLLIFNGALAQADEHESIFKYGYDYGNMYDDNDEKYIISATVTPTNSRADSYLRMRRFENPFRTLGPDDISDVKGALKDLFANRRIGNPFTVMDPVIGNVSRNNTFQYDGDGGKVNVLTNVITTTIESATMFKNHPTLSSAKFFKLPPIEQLEEAVPHDIARTAQQIDSFSSDKGRTIDILRQEAKLVVTPTLDDRDGVNVIVDGATTQKHKIDINALVNLIANLTYEYEMNLTKEFNETLQKYNIPTCPSLVVTTTTEQTTTEYFANATVIAKCFVCGLSEPGVPTNGNCGDAFATDFMPLVPIDPKARGQVSKYRKFCRYLDTPNYFFNETIPHSIFGRWTGGCAVRWTDLTNTYTQRTCRQRLNPTTGRHFGSKRMAKLELALKDVQNGCLISPMATLLPLSRGVSLYARFHACVCTGSWCNRSMDSKRCIKYSLIMSFLVFYLS